jgi:drug/metabolite transporter (DMT)-like permease
MLNSLSGLLDKLLMRDNTLSSGELQFWYMLFLVCFYGIYMLVTRSKMQWKRALKNYWIWILSILFVIGDRALFIANASPDSRVTVMTLIKQSGCFVTILGGKYIFKEKNIEYKLLCAGVILAGIVAAVL